jgi:hypothetical protein
MSRYQASSTPLCSGGNVTTREMEGLVQSSRPSCPSAFSATLPVADKALLSDFQDSTRHLGALAAVRTAFCRVLMQPPSPVVWSSYAGYSGPSCFRALQGIHAHSLAPNQRFGCQSFDSQYRCNENHDDMLPALKCCSECTDGSLPFCNI